MAPKALTFLLVIGAVTAMLGATTSSANATTLTQDGIKQNVGAFLGERHGTQFQTSPSKRIDCGQNPIQEAVEETDDHEAFDEQGFCTFSFIDVAADKRVYGYATVTLTSDGTKTRASEFSQPGRYQDCGSYNYYRPELRGWKPYLQYGSNFHVWSFKVSCVRARKLVLKQNGRDRFSDFICRRQRLAARMMSRVCRNKRGQIISYKGGD